MSDKGSEEGKVFNLVRGLQQEIDEDPNAAAVLQPLEDRAERILRDLEGSRTTGLAAMDLLAALAAERDARAGQPVPPYFSRLVPDEWAHWKYYARMDTLLLSKH